MQLKKLLEKWDLTSLQIKTPFLEMEWQPRDEDKTAAWELYVEMITRAATQHLDPEEGDEAAALRSIYDLFALTRDTIKRNGRHCINFTRIAVVVQTDLRNYTRLLADLADVEDLTDLEAVRAEPRRARDPARSPARRRHRPLRRLPELQPPRPGGGRPARGRPP